MIALLQGFSVSHTSTCDHKKLGVKVTENCSINCSTVTSLLLTKEKQTERHFLFCLLKKLYLSQNYKNTLYLKPHCWGNHRVKTHHCFLVCDAAKEAFPQVVRVTAGLQLFTVESLDCLKRKSTIVTNLFMMYTSGSSVQKHAQMCWCCCEILCSCRLITPLHNRDTVNHSTKEFPCRACFYFDFLFTCLYFWIDLVDLVFCLWALVPKCVALK